MIDLNNFAYNYIKFYDPSWILVCFFKSTGFIVLLFNEQVFERWCSFCKVNGCGLWENSTKFWLVLDKVLVFTFYGLDIWTPLGKKGKIFLCVLGSYFEATFLFSKCISARVLVIKNSG